MNSDNTRITMAGASFRGAAKMWYYYIRGSPHQAAHVNNLTWEYFKASMIKNFKPLDPIRIARDQLASLTQLGDISSYTTEYRRLVMIIPNIHEDDQVDKYLRGLKPWVRKEVDLRAGNERVGKLEDAISLATKVEMNSEYNRRGPQPPPYPKPNNHGYHRSQRSYSRDDRRADDPMDVDAVYLKRQHPHP